MTSYQQQPQKNRIGRQVAVNRSDINSLRATKTGVTFDMFIDPTLSIDIKNNDPGSPGGFCPGDKYPTSLNQTTTIGYILPHRSHVRLSVRDAVGREVGRFVDDVVSAGVHSVMWDGRDTQGNAASSGINLYSIMTDTFLESRQMTLVK